MSDHDLKKISSDVIQEYIFAHSDADEKKLLLQTRQILGLPTAVIAQQLAIRRKAESKLPSFYQTKGIVYPPTLNWEQCSSEATANLKAEIIGREIDNRKIKVADLTGGFGIDSYFISKKAESLDFIEPDTALLNIAIYNHHRLGCTNLQYHSTDAAGFLDHPKKKYDLIYLDPSRRDASSKKVFRLADCRPDITGLLPRLLKFTEFVLIKTSPLLDIHQGLCELTSVKKIIVISVNNECKELLFLLQKGFSEDPFIDTYNINKFGDTKQFLSFTFNEEKNTESDFGEPQTYLYEPNASILKAGAFKFAGRKFGLQKLHVNTHFYTSTRLEKDFPGRIFEINLIAFDPESLPGMKANVIVRNYPLTAEELKKKLKLSDGGENYVIGFSGTKKKYVVLASRLE